MSTVVVKPPKVIRVTQKAEESAADWIKGVLDGSGSSPAQIIVAVVIGCIPFVGQGVDVGNVIVSVIKIAEKPENKDNWFDLVFNLIAFVPVAGDGLKIVFKQLRSAPRARCRFTTSRRGRYFVSRRKRIQHANLA